MLLLGIITLVMTIPLASVYLSSISHKIVFLILLLSVMFSCNTLLGLTLSTEVDLLGGLLQILQYLSTYDILLSTFIPVIIYYNAETDKKVILSDNKEKAGIYLWTHKESNKKYVGSAVDLSKRFKNYYSITYLTRSSNSYINNALIKYGNSAFFLTILEYIDISHLSEDEAKTIILKREQYYIDNLTPEYNINPIAGSRLGSLHSAETLAKLREANSGENNPNFGKNHSAEIKAKISAANGTTVYVYSSDGSTLINTFSSARNTAQHYKCGKSTILRYIKNGKLFKEKYILAINHL